MARFTSIGMPRKTFVASAAEESAPQEEYDAGPSNTEALTGEKKKRKRSKGGKGASTDEVVMPEQPAAAEVTPVSKGWGRDENIAKKARHNAERTDVRRGVRQVTKHSSTTCFACRSVGHAARDCPNVLLAASGGGGSASMLENAGGKKEGMKRKKGKMGGEVTGGKCYRCDSTEHSLSACPHPIDSKNPTPYATCFICLATGHLSSLCPQNPGRGIYVNGGSCKVCGSVAHRAKDCPDDKRGPKASTNTSESGPILAKKNDLLLGTGSGAGADEDDFIVERRQVLELTAQEKAAKEKEKKGKRAKHEPAKNSFRGPAKPLTFSAIAAEIVPGSNPIVGDAAEISNEEPAPLRKIGVASGPKPKAKVVKF